MARVHDYFYGDIDTDCIVMVGGEADGRVIGPRVMPLGEECFVQFEQGFIGKYKYKGNEDKFGRRLMEFKGVEKNG